MLRSSLLISMLCILTLLSGCATPTTLVKTEVIKVPYLTPLPAGLTGACVAARLPSQNELPLSAVLAWGQQNRELLEECAKRMDQIRELQPAASAPPTG